MENITLDMSFPCQTNNPVLDILLANKLGVAKGNHIDVSCSLFLPYPCGINDIDLCILLSNALDNAIQACRKLDANSEKYIHVSGNVQGDFVLFDIRNSCEAGTHFSEGTGLKNIKTVAEKYNGAVQIQAPEQEFVLNVLLIIPRQEDDISRQNA